MHGSSEARSSEPGCDFTGRFLVTGEVGGCNGEVPAGQSSTKWPSAQSFSASYWRGVSAHQVMYVPPGMPPPGFVSLVGDAAGRPTGSNPSPPSPHIWGIFA